MAAQERPRRQWQEAPPVDVPQPLADLVGGHALVAQHLARKGITSVSAAERFLYAERYDAGVAQ